MRLAIRDNRVARKWFAIWPVYLRDRKELVWLESVWKIPILYVNMVNAIQVERYEYSSFPLSPIMPEIPEESAFDKARREDRELYAKDPDAYIRRSREAVANYCFHEDGY